MAATTLSLVIYGALALWQSPNGDNKNNAREIYWHMLLLEELRNCIPNGDVSILEKSNQMNVCGRSNQ